MSILSKDFIEFNFPKPIKLDKVMKDYLEEEVDEKYYINNEKSEKLIKQLVESGVLSDNADNNGKTDRQTDRTEQNRLSSDKDCVNNRHGKRQSEVPGEVQHDRLCVDTSRPGLQGTCELRENECSNCKMLGMMGTEGFEKVRRVYATDALVPAISTKEDRIKILTENGVTEW